VAGAEDKRRVSLRLPEHLADRLERAAATDRRSVNAYLTLLLEHVLPEDPQQAAFDLRAAG
jgi:hypothetical protein